MNKKHYVLPLVTSVAASVCSCACPVENDAQQQKVNIIHIMSDDHSYQTISAYGSAVSKVAPTPNLDRLAARGMLFRHAYVENSISSPSRATLLTGKYSHFHGKYLLGNKCTFDPCQTTFPALLHDAGYQTAIVGKWHLDGTPDGFDHYKILRGQGTYYNPEFRTEADPEKYEVSHGYVAHLITDDAINWLDNRDPEKPFCLMVHHKSVHRHWNPELKYLHLYDDVKFPEPATLFDDYNTRCGAAQSQSMTIQQEMDLAVDNKIDQLIPTKGKKSEYYTEVGRLTPEEQALYKESYRDENEAFLSSNLSGNDLISWKYQRYLHDYTRCVKSLDDEIGRLLDYLEANGLMDNTIITYCSDQGFYMGEHGWFDKRFMYEESFRTPLIVCFPGHMPEGSVCDALVQNIDFAPTYLSVAGVDVPEDMCGRSLAPLFKNGKAPKGWRKDLYYHYYDYPAIHNVRRHDGVSDGHFKLIHFKDNGGGNRGKDEPIDAWELYDLDNDPAELNNVFGQKGYEKITKKLSKRLEEYRNEYSIPEYEEKYFGAESAAK